MKNMKNEFLIFMKDVHLMLMKYKYFTYDLWHYDDSGLLIMCQCFYKEIKEFMFTDLLQ